MTEIPESVRKAFEATIFAKGGGACFECCDYESMYEDLLQFIAAQRESAVRENIEQMQKAYETMKYHEERHGESSQQMFENWKKGEEFPCYEYNEWLLAYMQFKPEIAEHL